MKEFVQISKKNINDSNLTELNAASSIERGFMNHNDWVGHAVRYGHCMDVIQKTKAKTVLDVGCGSLQMLRYIWRNRSTFDGHYVGVDLRASQKWLDDIGWEKGDVTLIQMDILDDVLPLNVPDKYDVVICTEVLEHVPRNRAQDLVDRLMDWVKPGGRLILSTPNAGVSDSTADNHKDKNGVSREWSYDDKIMMVQTAGGQLLDAWGSFIAIRNIPEEFLAMPEIQKIRNFMPYAWFTVFAASNFPRQSNNATMEFTK